MPDFTYNNAESSSVPISWLSGPIKRLFCSRHIGDLTDNLGFLDIGRTPNLCDINKLFTHSAAIVWGAPFIGKTYVARLINGSIREGALNIGFQARFTLSFLDQPLQRPDWWDAWLNNNSPPPACWIVDGLDEAHDYCHSNIHMFLEYVKQMSESHREALKLVVFSRQRPELLAFEDELAELCPLGKTASYQLARMDKHTAKEMLGDDYERVIDVIVQNKLEPIAGYPRVLQYLQHHRNVGNIFDVWRGVLLELFEHPPHKRLLSQPTKRFDAAKQMAAVLSLTDFQLIRLSSPVPDVPTIASVFDTAISKEDLLQAAKEACHCEAFAPSPEQDAYRFSQRNIQDWLTAFRFADLPAKKLRSAIAEKQGQVFPRFREIVQLLRQISMKKETQQMIDDLQGGVTLPGDGTPPQLEYSIECLNKLESIALSSPSGLRTFQWKGDSIKRLKVSGFSEELRKKLLDANRDAKAKRVVLEIARIIGCHELIDLAIKIVLDQSECDELRTDAMWFVRELGGNDHFRQLEEPIALTSRDSDIEHRLRAIVILELVDRGFWTWGKAASYGPPPQPDLTDGRALLLYRIEREMTIDDAIVILANHRKIIERHQKQDDEYRLPGIIQNAIDKALALTLDDEHEQFLAKLAIEVSDANNWWDHSRKIFFKLRPKAQYRYLFYTDDVRAIAEQRRNGHHWFDALDHDDWKWLLEKATSEWQHHEFVWDDLYFRGRLATEEGNKDSEGWNRITVAVNKYAPEVPRRFARSLEARKRCEERHKKMEEEIAANTPIAKPIGYWVDKLLDDQAIDDQTRMRFLSRYCFFADWRPKDVEGNWEDISEENRIRVIEACRRGLEQGTPDDIPEGETFSGRILYDAYAFAAVVTWSVHSVSVDSNLIRKWLPIALFGLRISTEITRACWEIDEPATHDVLADAMACELHTKNYAYVAHYTPSECWTEDFGKEIARLLEVEKGKPESKISLLEVLTIRAPEIAHPLAAKWSQTDDKALRMGAINCLLAIDPDSGLDEVEKRYAEEGFELLEKLTVFWGSNEELHIKLFVRPNLQLERIAEILLDAVPMTEGENDGDGFVTPRDELRRTRDDIIQVLIDRNDVEAKEVLQRLGELAPLVKKWVNRVEAHRSANELLGSVNPPVDKDPSKLTLQQAVAVLDSADYRLIRNNDDLMYAVLEILEIVSADVAYNLPMLYQRPEISSGKKKDERKHLGEDALQAYIRRRLVDLLPSRIDPIGQALREDQVKYGRRLDIRVQAPFINVQELGTVVIEVKWSDNPERAKGLVDQLGRKYLLDEKQTHGIYLVAWCGTPVKKERMEKDLHKRRDEFCAVGADGEALMIEPVVLDFRWRDSLSQ